MPAGKSFLSTSLSVGADGLPIFSGGLFADSAKKSIVSASAIKPFSGFDMTLMTNANSEADNKKANIGDAMGDDDDDDND